METIVKSLETSGGYAVLAGLMMLGFFYIFRGWVADQAIRQAEREALIRNDNAENMEHERATSENYRAMNERMIHVIEGNTGAITTLVETIRPMNETLARLERQMGVEPPRRNSPGTQSK